MNIDFIATLDDDYTIKIYDVSNVSTSLPSEINSMTLDIISSKIPNGRIDNRLDVIAYLQGSRIDREIYTIQSEVLGLSNGEVIPDGVYNFTYNINNNTIKERSFLVYNTVNKAVEEMLKAVNYSIEVGSYDIEYVGDTSEYDIEKVRLAVALRDELVAYTQEPDEVAVNDTLDKLTRLLEIINTDLNT